MDTSDDDRELAAQAVRIKQASVKHNARVFWILGVLFVLGVVVGVAVWFGQIPMNRDQAHSSLAFGSGVAVFCIGGALSWALFPRPETQCPKCRCDWKLETDNSSNWLDWKRCPRCGLDLTLDGLPRASC